MLADIAYFNSPRTRQVYVSILRKSSIELGRNKGPARIEFRSFSRLRKKTTARLNMLSRFRDFRDKGRVVVASAAACRSFPAQLGVDLRRLHRQIPQAD
jgi:hypothetical protein